MKVTNEGGTQTYEAKNIIIATGTKPADSPRVPINGRSIVNSDQILDLPNLPKSLIVVGGGVIGVEYTCMFAALGVRVTLIEKRPKLLEFADQEIVEALSYHLRDSRVTMRLHEEVESVEELPDCSVVANLESKKRISGGALLYAVGRSGNVDELNLAAVGIEPDSSRPHPGRQRLPHQGAEHFRGGRRDRLSQPGFGVDGAGPYRRGAGLRQREPGIQSRATTRTAFIRSRRSRSSARRKSS